MINKKAGLTPKEEKRYLATGISRFFESLQGAIIDVFIKPVKPPKK